MRHVPAATIVATTVRSCGPSSSTNSTRCHRPSRSTTVDDRQGHRTAEQHGPAVRVAVGAFRVGAVDDAAGGVVVVVGQVARCETFELPEEVAVQQRFPFVDEHGGRGVQRVHDEDPATQAGECEELLELVGEVDDLALGRRRQAEAQVRAVWIDACGRSRSTDAMSGAKAGVLMRAPAPPRVRDVRAPDRCHWQHRRDARRSLERPVSTR